MLRWIMDSTLAWSAGQTDLPEVTGIIVVGAESCGSLYFDPPHWRGGKVLDSQFRFVDLFAGLGGFHVALANLGGEGVFAAEWEPVLNDLYSKNFGIKPWGDITTLDTDADIQDSIPDHEILTAGFPCQPFSKAGDQLGFEDTAQGTLFFTVLHILKVKRPRWFILENVPNILKHDGGRTLETITKELVDLGYEVDFTHFSPHQFGIPQVRDRAYFVGSLEGLGDFRWPDAHPIDTNICSVLHKSPKVTRQIPELTLHAIDMWGDFLKRSPAELKLPSFPIWAMEFGATYPYEEETPARVWKRRPVWGFRGMNTAGSFGVPLDGLKISEQQQLIPSHSRRENDFTFPRWKRNYIRQNREFYNENKRWIEPWLEKWQPWTFPSSFQKMEWNAQGEVRDIDNFVLQVRASGIRVKRPSTAPSLIAFTQTQVPILGANLTCDRIRRYMTPAECAELQSLSSIELPSNDLAAYKALGNAVNAKVVEAIARPLIRPGETPEASRIINGDSASSLLCENGG